MPRNVRKIGRLDFEPDVAIGVGLPFGISNVFNLNYETKEQVKDNLRNLVLTIKGERVFNPRFGCDVYKLIFDPNTAQLELSIRNTLTDAINEFLPYINLIDVVTERNDTTLTIKIAYSIPDFRVEDVLTVSVDTA